MCCKRNSDGLSINLCFSIAHLSWKCHLEQYKKLNGSEIATHKSKVVKPNIAIGDDTIEIKENKK